MGTIRAAMAVLAFLAASGLGPAAAQTPVEVGDRVRILMPNGGGRAEGVVQEIGPDSLVVSGRSRVSVPLEYLTGAYQRLSRRKGTMAEEYALGGGLALGFIGFQFGYCFQVFGGGCSGNLEGGLKGAGVAGAIGGVLGLMIGSAIPEYELARIDGGRQSVSARVLPVVSGTMPLTLSATIQLGL